MTAVPLLSVLDLSPIRPGSTGADALRDTLRLAEAADRLGYRRYWLAEHHSDTLQACTSPEIMVGQIAARTARIRVGSGGVRLSHYSPLKVAENFRVLEALYPGRIDLGICRSGGSGPETAALAVGPGALPRDQFPRQVADVLAFLHDTLVEDHPFAGVHAMPVGPTSPEVWLLGSGTESARLAARFGTSFSFAHFISPDAGPGVVEAYSEMFSPSACLTRPRASLAVEVICHESEEQAQRLLERDLLYYSRRHRQPNVPYPTVAETERHSFSQQELALIANQRSRTIVDNPDRVRDRLLRLAAEYGVAELVVKTMVLDFEARRRSYELLAEAFELGRSEARAAA